MKHFASLFILSMILLTSSCVKKMEFDKMAAPKWNPNIAVPLISSKLKIEDLLKKVDSSAINVGSDKLISFVYKSNLPSLTAEQVVILPNQSFNNTYVLSSTEIAAFTLLPVGSDYVVNRIDTFNFNPGNGILIDSILFKSGALNIALSSQLMHNMKIDVTVPKAKKNGIPATLTANLNFTGSIPATNNTNIDLTGYSVDMNTGGSNMLEIHSTITITKSANPFTGTEQTSLNHNYSNMAFSKAFGYFGQQNISISQDTLDVSFFDALSTFGGIQFANPKLNATIKNSYGMPIGASISPFYALVGSGSTNITGAPNPLPVNSPTINEIGQTKTSSFSMDNTNSNLTTVLASNPSYLVFGLNATTNPNGNQGQNFFLDTSNVKIDIEFELPLYGRTSGISIQDTIDFSFENLDIVESLLIRANINNGFPLEAKVQVYFADSLFVVKDSLVTTTNQLLMAAAPVDANGKVTGPVSSTNDFVITAAKFDKLSTVKKLLIKGILKTYNSPNTDVKIYSDYELGVKLGVQAKLMLN